jgi:Uma2 family endonuclease
MSKAHKEYHPETRKMATVLVTPEQRVLMQNIDWETYERLLTAHRDSSSPRITFDRGLLEIMSPSAEHEELKDIITLLANVWAEELGVDIRSFGSTTFRREDLARGFEPDGCFYIQSVESIRARTNLDLKEDPPPDLIVEIDITNPSIDKLAIYAQIGVPEVWRYDGKRLAILSLVGDRYIEHEESHALAGLTSSIISRFLEAVRNARRPDWLRDLRECARSPR